MASVAAVDDVLTLPTMLAFCTPQDICALSATSKALQPTDATWRAICCSTAATHGLFLPRQSRAGAAPPLGLTWRRVFFDHIWPARFKWRTSGGVSRFGVQVAVRFRAGDRGSGRLMLPLHQRLRVRNAGESIADKEPPEFLDPLMNSIMTEPVLLPTSGRYGRAC